MTPHAMRHGGAAPSRVFPPSVQGPGGSPPAPDDPPGGAIVPPAPLVPVVMAPPVPPAPDFPELPRSGGSWDEQLEAIARTDAHRKTMPKHWRDRFVISS